MMLLREDLRMQLTARQTRFHLIEYIEEEEKKKEKMKLFLVAKRGLNTSSSSRCFFSSDEQIILLTRSFESISCMCNCSEEINNSLRTSPPLQCHFSVVFSSSSSRDHQNMSASFIDSYSSLENDSLLLRHVRTIVKFYIWPLLVLFGLTGNCLSILVLTRRRLIRTSTNNYLTILAVFDSCYLISTLLLNLGSHPKFASSSWTKIFLYYLRPLADFSSNTATWLIVCFTIERTLAVTKPIYAKRRCSVRRSRHLIGVLLLISFLITLPRFFEKNFINQYSNMTKAENISHEQVFFVNFHRFYLVLICVIIIWIPLLVLCICNSILIW